MNEVQNIKKIPTSWKWVKVSSIAELFRGINYTKDVASNNPFKEGLPILRANNINGELNFDDLVYVPKTLIKQEQLIKKDDIIFAMSSGSKHLVGKSAVAKRDFKGSYGAFCALLRIQDGINKKYISYVFQGNAFRKLISEIAKGTNINNLKREHILDFELPLPPISIQNAIVSKIEELFSELDKGIENLRLAQQQLELYKKAVLMDGVTGKLTTKWRHKNPNVENSEIIYQQIQTHLDKKYKLVTDEAVLNGRRKPKDQRKNKKLMNTDVILPALPQKWEYYRLEDITYLVTDGTHFTPDYKDSGVKFLSVKNVRPFHFKDEQIKYISEEEHKMLMERCYPEKGDILYTKIGATFGYAAKVKVDYDFSIFVSLCLIKPINDFFSSDFLEMLMNSELVFNQARTRVSGSGVPDLHLIEIRDFKIPLPTLKEQNEIVKEIESRLSVADKMEECITKSLQHAMSLRQSILKNAFEGKLG